MPSAPNPPTVEENVPWTSSSSRTGRSVGRSSSSRVSSSRHSFTSAPAQVDEAGADVVLHLVDGLLEDRRRDEPEHQRLRRALREIAEQALGAPLHPCPGRGSRTARCGASRRGTWCARPGSPAGARSRRRRARAGRPRPHREVRRPPAAPSPCCRPASRRGPWSCEASGPPARPARDLRPRAPRRARPCRPDGRLGAARQVTRPGLRGRLGVVRRRRGDPQRAPREGRRHDVNSPPRQPSARACQT